MPKANGKVNFTPHSEKTKEELPTFEEKTITVTGGTEPEIKNEPSILTPEELKKFSPKEEIDEITEDEERELTEEEQRELFIDALKKSKIRFKNTIHKGNVTTTKFGSAYRKKRKNKSRMQKASRRANRK